MKNFFHTLITTAVLLTGVVGVTQAETTQITQEELVTATINVKALNTEVQRLAQEPRSKKTLKDEVRIPDKINKNVQDVWSGIDAVTPTRLPEPVEPAPVEPTPEPAKPEIPEDLQTEVELDTQEVVTTPDSVLVIGDSLTVGTQTMISTTLEQQLINAGISNVSVSAKSGRSTDTGISILRDVSPQSGTVVMALGTNDFWLSQSAFAQKIDTVMSLVPSTVDVYWVNLFMGSGYEYAQINAAINERVSSYSNLHVVDFSSIASTSWLAGDNVHFGSSGYDARAEQIVSAVSALVVPELREAADQAAIEAAEAVASHYEETSPHDQKEDFFTEADIEILTAEGYQWSSGSSVTNKELQKVLHISSDGVYGNGTYSAHKAALETLNLPLDALAERPENIVYPGEPDLVVSSCTPTDNKGRAVQATPLYLSFYEPFCEKAKANGMYATSSYRSYTYQQYLYDTLGDSVALAPWLSNHTSGNAIDVGGALGWRHQIVGCMNETSGVYTPIAPISHTSYQVADCAADGVEGDQIMPVKQSQIYGLSPRCEAPGPDANWADIDVVRCSSAQRSSDGIIREEWHYDVDLRFYGLA